MLRSTKCLIRIFNDQKAYADSTIRPGIGFLLAKKFIHQAGLKLLGGKGDMGENTAAGK